MLLENVHGKQIVALHDLCYSLRRRRGGDIVDSPSAEMASAKLAILEAHPGARTIGNHERQCAVSSPRLNLTLLSS